MNYAAPTAQELKDRTERNRVLQDKLREIQLKNPTWSYDKVWQTANAAPEMQPVVAEMDQPLAVGSTANAVTDAPSPQRIAGAKFRGLAQKAVKERGIAFDAAWAAMKEEEPELYAAMSKDAPGTADAYKDPHQPLAFTSTATGDPKFGWKNTSV
jgi:acyl-CoA reductase-like NAD-dependent aldehyde dehydrogenase